MQLPITIHRHCSFFGDYVPWYAISVGVALAVMAIGLFLELHKHRTGSETRFLICFPLSLVFGVVLACVFDSALSPSQLLTVMLFVVGLVLLLVCRLGRKQRVRQI